MVRGGLGCSFMVTDRTYVKQRKQGLVYGWWIILYVCPAGFYLICSLVLVFSFIRSFICTHRFIRAEIFLSSEQHTRTKCHYKGCNGALQRLRNYSIEQVHHVGLPAVATAFNVALHSSHLNKRNFSFNTLEQASFLRLHCEYLK